MNTAAEEFCEECGGPLNQMGQARNPVTSVEGLQFCSDYCFDEWERRSRQSYVKPHKKPKVKRVL